MNNGTSEPSWEKLHHWLMGLVALVTAIVELILLSRGHFVLVAIVFVVVGWIGCLYVWIRRKKIIEGGRGVPVFSEKVRFLALIGLVALPSVTIGVLLERYSVIPAKSTPSASPAVAVVGAQTATASVSTLIPPTAVPVPPTDTSTPELPTNTPVPELTDTPTLTPTPTVTGTPTNTPTRTATPTNTPTPTPTPDAVIVAPVNLRSGPGTAHNSIGTLRPGQVLTVTGRIADTTWLQVNTNQMQEGWVINRADLVTLNLPVEQIPISPLPLNMSFQNFEPDNGTPPGGGNYFWDAWFTACSFESAIVREGSRAVHVDAHAAAQGNPGDHGGTMGINPSSSDPIDLSSATTLSVWVYDTLGNNTLELRLRDNNDALSNEVWSEMHAEKDNWTEITWFPSDFTGVDLSQIKNIELYEWWDGVYYFDAVSWQSCPYQAYTDADTIVRLIQAESEAIKRKDISIIRAIFAKDAIIRDGARGEQWNDPISRYEKLFAEATFPDAVHLDIQSAGNGITKAAAWFTSGSKGNYVTWDGHSDSYDNPPCSDHWTLGRNSSGCWVITSFTFNACHITFPHE